MILSSNNLKSGEYRIKDMDIELYRSEAQREIEKGCIRRIDFSSTTYQLEVYDSKHQKNFWPFLQFDQEGSVLDAFCSCPSQKDGVCLHLAIAYIKIFKGTLKPLHFRFESSFWNVLCALSADHAGYELSNFKKEKERFCIFKNDFNFSIQAKGSIAKKQLKNWIEQKEIQTPENSIKFSNLLQEEIVWWREGRPSPHLRYTLCFWSDLAKWAFIHNEEAKICFEEDEEGIPTKLTVLFPTFSMYWKLSVYDLDKLITPLSTVKSSLKLLQADHKQIQSISYDPRNSCFKIEHIELEGGDKKGEGKEIGKWMYYPKLGFSAREGESMLSQARIEKKDIPTFLDQFSNQISRFIPFFKKPLKLSYMLFFDEDWNWHFEAYLFDLGDLQKSGASLFGKWAYLPQKGFYRIKELLFHEITTVLSSSEVCHFVHQNRIWLNGQVGFQTHLASIESQVSYSVTREGTLCFHSSATKESMDSHDFEDWVYYKGQGFFSKENVRTGQSIPPATTIPSNEIPNFIKRYREELENIPHFFASHLSTTKRGLEVVIKSEISLHVKPVYKDKEKTWFFGEFIFREGEGFCELPVHMRLPDFYQKERVIKQGDLFSFLEDDFPSLKQHIFHLDSRLKIPLKCDLVLQDLVRTGKGSLQARFAFHTEIGIVPISLIFEGYEKKHRYLFSEAGLIDLHNPQYQWIRDLTRQPQSESGIVELTTLEFMRLDATFPILNLFENDNTPEITRKTLSELREFTTHEPADKKGLKSELRLYQETGFQWLWFLYKNSLSALLCDDMGLGKTHQAMALLAASLNEINNREKRFLIVCPTSVIYHWQDKLANFLPKVKVEKFYGLKRSLKHLPKEGIILTTYGILRMERKAMEKIAFEVAIFDEVQIAKNPKSRVHHALSHVRAHMCVGLTGTPIENNLCELKSLFDLILPGYMPKEGLYRKMFIIPIEKERDEEKKALLRRLIRPFVLRRKKSEVLQELPDKSEDKSYCNLSEQQTKLYNETLNMHRNVLISELYNEDIPLSYMHIFALLSRLKQICNHPALVSKDPKNYKKYASGKWDLFKELLKEARESEQKVVVFSQYLYMLDIMENYLLEKGWGYAQIRGDTLNRHEELKRFEKDPSCIVFIGSLQAAGLGIDLTAASVVILYDRWWNAARENQAIDRVHRIGQKWGVQVYKLIVKQTIEEKIDKMITKKGKLLEEVITTDDQAVLKNFSRSELIDLLLT